MSERVSWPAAGAGAVVAILLTLAFSGQLAGTLAAVAAGALVSGRLARRAGALQGAVAGALWIGLATVTGWAPVPEDTVGVIVYDLAHLSVGAAAGWLGARLST